MPLLNRIRMRMPKGTTEAPPESAAVRGDLRPPEAFDWQTYGQTGQVLAGRPGVGHETPGVWADWMRRLGHRDGAARLSDEQTMKDGAPPLKIAEQAGKVRIGLANQALMRRVAPLEQVINQAPGLIKAIRAKVAMLAKKLEHQYAELGTMRAKLPPLELKATECKNEFDQARDGFMQLPRLARGYFDSYKPVAFAATGVVVFDVFVLHGALQFSGLDPVTVWGTSLTVPLAIAGANHGFGVLAGAIGLRVPGGHRLKLAAAAFISGFGSMVIAYLLLMIFRTEAAHSMNAALTALATGHAGAQLAFFVSPVWMGPLQIGGSFAAVCLTALWTMAKQGREYRQQVLQPKEATWLKAEADVKDCEAEVDVAMTEADQIRAEIEAGVLETFEIESQADGARAEVIALTKEFQALVATDTALATEMGEIYKAERNYVQATYANGGVWRMQLATVYPRRGRPYTPGPSEAGADDELIKRRHRQAEPETPKPAQPEPDTEPSPNGKRHHTVDPDELKAL